MEVKINRLDPNVPIRRAAGARPDGGALCLCDGRVRVLAFFIIYFRPRPSSISAVRAPSRPAILVSLPYTVQVTHMNLEPGATVKAGEDIAEVVSPERTASSQTYMQRWRTSPGRTAELRIKARVAQESLEASRSYQLVPRKQ